jgi:hypothetical protein
LPFTFQFYDQEFTSIYVSSNGWFSFENTNPFRFDSLSFPTALTDYHYSGALFMCDLDPTNNDVYVHFTSQYFAIEYRSINHYGGSLAGTFEFVLYRNGVIKFLYDNIAFLGPGPTVGLNYGYDTTYYNYCPELVTTAEEELSLKFTYPGTFTNVYIGVGVAGGLVVIGGIIGMVFFVRSRRARLGFLGDNVDSSLVFHDYVTLEQEANRLRTPEERIIIKIQNKIKEIFKLYKNNDVILLDVLAEQCQAEDYLVEEAFNQLLVTEEIKGKLNLMAKEFIVEK